jgi:arylsulfatase A-like enzyme
MGTRGAAAWLKRQPGTVFENAWSQAPTTNSSVATIVTGLLPSQHGVFDGGGALPREVPTLAEHFQGAGYATGHITANPNSGPAYNLDRGFRVVRWSGRGEASDLLHQQLQHAEGIASLASEFLKQTKEPFLLSLHFNDAHSPYDPSRSPAPMKGVRRIYDEPSSDPSVGRVTAHERADMLARYDAEIAAVDRALSRVVQQLQRTGVWDRTLLVVTADHGEEFRDHGRWGHSHSLYQELLHVPLFIREPGDVQRRVRPERINLADLLPTVLQLSGLPPAARTWGRSRAALLRGGGEPAEFTVAEKLSTEKGGQLRAYVTDRAGLIEHLQGNAELYDHHRDPKQMRNLAATRPREVEALQNVLEKAVLAAPRPGPARAAAIDSDTLRHLQSLGYLQGRKGASGPAAHGADDPAPAIRTILARPFATRPLWSAISAGSLIAMDNSSRSFQVQIPVSAGAWRGRRVRLRFAAAEHSTTISDVRVTTPAASSRRVTFDGQVRRRFPAGAVIDSDALVGPAGDRWLVSFRTEPLALVRVAAALRSRLAPLASSGSQPSPEAPQTIDGTVGLIAIVDGAQ